MEESCLPEVANVKKRTLDVKVKDNVDFESLLLSQDVLAGLKKCGFEKPSPVQLKAIPLGRCGLDLVVQAKSGTGKTCVFSVIALESILLNSPGTQVLILAPTREIAVQIWEVINSISVTMSKLRCYAFIGGLPLSEDKVKLKKCHIAVGTPGRVKQLIEEQVLNTESIRLFILDEADKLMEQGFQETINWIFSSLPENKQVLALSATYPEVLAKHLTAYMRNPTFVRLNTDDLSLLGIRQYYKTVQFSPLQQKAFEIKCKALLDLFNAVSFQQCLVFSNYQLRAQSLSDVLNREGWPATYISGSQDQQDRLTAMSKLKSFKCRVLISTDLTSRGIDAENVNLVINMDIPHDHETYLHRIGRAGRYGTYGAAITLVSLGKEMANLKEIENKAKTRILPLSDPVSADLAQASGFVDYSDQITVESMKSFETNMAVLSDSRVHNDIERASDLHSATGNGNHFHGVQDGRVNTRKVLNQENVYFLADKQETNRQLTEDGSKECTENDKGVEDLIETLQTTVISEYTKMEQLLTLADVHASGQIGGSCSLDQSIDGEQVNSAPHSLTKSNNNQAPVDEVCEMTKEVEQSLITTDTILHESPTVFQLPKADLLHTFARSVNNSHIIVPDFVLPVLSDIIGRTKKIHQSYADIMADYEQFQSTGKSTLHSNHISDFYDSGSYDVVLHKVDAFLKDIHFETSENIVVQRGAYTNRIDSQEEANTSEVQCSFTEKKEYNLEKTTATLGKCDVHHTSSLSKSEGDSFKKHSSNTRPTEEASNHKECVTLDGCMQPAQDDVKILGFSELSSHFNKSNVLSSSSGQGARKKISVNQMKEKGNKHITRPPHTAEERKIGLDFIKRLQAQQDTDSGNSDSSSSESDSESNESCISSSPDEEVLGKGYQENIHDRYKDASNNEQVDMPPYINGSTFAQIYGEQSTGWDHQRAYGYPDWYYSQSRMNAECLPDEGTRISQDGRMESFPYQLWMQCANLLGSINAMQAAQYSWYCQQCYLYHTKYAKFYVDHYKKYKAKLKRHKQPEW
ncbi:hypothetical protein LSH36_360g02029 [Paralvinella palmiformis]|uniref:RNA helicase n=1 Tax=Paralvinella palmiformis TaxID=53620 RepID=A0AAD9N281_9ANNE|nr:hypothetical protein LSH36_360g02029 [Paralvinella palmiformis]